MSAISQQNNVAGLDVNFNQVLTALPQTLTDLSATYTRASTKSVLQNGQIVSLANNQFGTDYDYRNNRYCYLPEPSATNKFTRATLEGVNAVPDGWTVGANNTGGTSTPVASSLGNASNCQAYTVTCAAQRNYIQATISGNAINTVFMFSIYIEAVSGGLLANQVLFATQTNGSATYPACEANPSGGGAGVLQTGRLLYRWTTGNPSGNITPRIGVGVGTSATGSLTWSRPQFEIGGKATSFIPTSGATATRAADVLSVPLASISGFSGNNFTLFVEGAISYTRTSNTVLLDLNDGATTNLSSIRLNTSPGIFATSITASVQQNGDNTSQGLTAGIKFRAGFSVAANSFLFAVNGVASTADTSGTVPTGLTTINIGGGPAGANPANDAIYNIKVIKGSYTQNQLNGITAL